MEINNLTKGDNKRRIKITDIVEEKVIKDDQELKKVKFITYDEATKQTFTMTDAWVIDSKGNKKIQGMWISVNDNESLIPTCTIAKVMDYYNVGTLGELINQFIYAYPDENNFLVVLACDLNKD